MIIFGSIILLFVAVGLVLGLIFGAGALLISVCWKVGLILIGLWAIVSIVKKICSKD